MADSTSYDEFVDKIIEVINQKENGAIIGMLQDRPGFVYIYVEMGAIVAIKYDQLSGVDAVKAIKHIENIKFGFHPNKIPEDYDKLPDVARVVDYLKPGISSELSSAQGSGSVESLETGINQTTLHQIKEAFLSAVGPIGDVIFDREMDKSPSQNDLIKNLAKHLKFKDDLENFYRDIE